MPGEGEAPEAEWPEPEWLGRVGYVEAWARQRERREAILAGQAPEAVWLLEHDPVITTGRRDPGIDEAALSVPVVRTERGGLATWHGPGQLVGYLLLDVGGRGLGVRRTVDAVQAGVIAWLATRGVLAGPREGYPGVWVGRDKICAIGMHFRAGVSMHGFALNLQVDPAVYAGFVPCGVAEGGVTSVDRAGGGEIAVADAAVPVGRSVVRALRTASGCGVLTPPPTSDS